MDEHRGTCRLCLRGRGLRESHFVPAALYPKGKKIGYATPTTSGTAPAEVKAHLLCGECEEKFNKNGESEVLRLLAPKITGKALPLLSSIDNAIPLRTLSDSIKVYAGPSVGIDTSRFAYFALSLAWRAAVHNWTLPDGTTLPPFDLGGYSEPVRRFLLGAASFPQEVLVVMTVCTDSDSREFWFIGETQTAPDYFTYRAQLVGVILIAWFGPKIPTRMKQVCCWSAPERPVLSADCSKVTRHLRDTLPPL